MKHRLYLIIVIMPMLIAACSSEVTVMTWNVQNLFDAHDDGTEYSDYDPGRDEWTESGVRRKCSIVARVIREACWGGPDIVALQEVENDRVLRLLNSEYLRGLSYAYALVTRASGSAANTALLSRYPVVNVKSHAVPADPDRPGRNILEAAVDCGGTLLYLFNNHWRSHSLGSRATEGERREAARIVSDRVRAIMEEDPRAEIIVCGDLNESHDEYSRRRGKYATALVPLDEADTADGSLVLARSYSWPDREGIVFYEPWYEIPADKRGSYVYGGKWLSYDHILMGAGLFDGRGLVYEKGSFKVVRLPFAVGENTGFPLKWDLRKKDGVSDHLPLIVRLENLNSKKNYEIHKKHEKEMN